MKVFFDQEFLKLTPTVSSDKQQQHPECFSEADLSVFIREHYQCLKKAIPQRF